METVTKPKKKNELLFFALRNTKLRIGLAIILFFVVLAIVGPHLAKYKPNEFAGAQNHSPRLNIGSGPHPSEMMSSHNSLLAWEQPLRWASWVEELAR